MLRKLAGFVVAPFPVALVQSAMVALWPKPGTGVGEHPASMFVVICICFYACGLLIGLPAWLVVRRRSASLKTYLLIGLLAALLPGTVILLAIVRGQQPSAYAIIYALLLFGVGGMAAGALFWLIAVRRKPSTDLKETFS